MNARRARLSSRIAARTRTSAFDALAGGTIIAATERCVCRQRVWRSVLIVASVVGALATAAVEADQGARSVVGSAITFGEGYVHFVPPPGFTVLTAEELAYTQPGAHQAVANAQRTTTIVYDFSDVRAPSADLEAGRKSMMGDFERRMPTAKWLASDVRRIGTLTWMYFEWTVPAATNRPALHQIALVGVVAGRILAFNFNSTVADFPQVEEALRTSMTTIVTTP